MNITRFLSLLVIGLLSFGSLSRLTAQNPYASTACYLTALSLHRSAELEAEEEVWEKVAKALNDTSTPIANAVAEIWGEYDEALDEANEQLVARMEVCIMLGPLGYDPTINPSDFSTTINNNYLPFTVNRTLVYEKMTTEGLERLESTTTNETVDIDGVTCRVVHELETLDGDLVEDTVDWFAQHSDGSVWYFGEISQNYEDGFLDNLDGSWRNGNDGAKAGVVMQGTPTMGGAYRQEFYPGEAEDMAEVVATGISVTVPAGTFTNCIKTREWTPIEPDSEEFKYYAPGIGLVLEEDVETGELLELIQIIN